MILGQYNIKVLTEENWLEPDPRVGDKEYYHNNKWISTVLRTRLKDNVPLEVKEQYSLAQSTILYGYFFAPLCLVGLRECYRVAEFAIDYKITILGIDRKSTSIRRSAEKLVKEIKGFIKTKDKEFLNMIKSIDINDEKSLSEIAKSSIEVKRKDFKSKINELAKRCIISDEEYWHTIRKKRNDASHLANPDNYFYSGPKNDFNITDPEKKQIYLSPGFVLCELGSLVYAIDSLFTDNDQSTNL